MFKIILSLVFIAATSFNSAKHITFIEKIEFTSNGCFGQCPIYKMTIENGNNGYLVAEKFNKQNGHFLATINKTEIEKIKSLINEVQKLHLKDYYNEGPTCGNISEIKIYLKDKVIITKSMRLSGPKPLQSLLAALIQIKENSQWQPVNH